MEPKFLDNGLPPFVAHISFHAGKNKNKPEKYVLAITSMKNDKVVFAKTWDTEKLPVKEMEVIMANYDCAKEFSSRLYPIEKDGSIQIHHLCSSDYLLNKKAFNQVVANYMKNQKRS